MKIENILKRPFIVAFFMFVVTIIVGLIVGVITLMTKIDFATYASIAVTFAVCYLAGVVYAIKNIELTKKTRLKISLYYVGMEIILAILYLVLFLIPETFQDSKSPFIYALFIFILLIILGVIYLGIVYLIIGFGNKLSKRKIK